MAADTFLFCHAKKSKKAGQGHISRVSQERTDLKMGHDENNVLTDDELVIVRDFLRRSTHAILYIRNENPRGFNVLNCT